MKITVIIDGQEKEIELSDEQINAIVKRYFESPTLNYCKATDIYTLANTDGVTTVSWDKLKTKEAKWKLIKENEYENDVNGEYYINTYACPFCNWKVRTEGEMDYRFCPMCGADLRGKEHDK